ncbi:FAD-dependent monooxygenase [Streptomyces sp. NBC_00038]|uniref:FAD-dependent monooxygenase n=1 Tax=Streptomyces sp. NBC_00038 TaxID=2903615 RepID=UPI00225AC3AB|nr:FAD-dependent monooxygenase [Streptomyces sp. NBC_00038]MCX5563662.1 FAD-dependent monooxygenase [Streptomyces sp. NBC_00038]
MDADVIVVGAGPTGLMLAGELRLGGARVVVVERLERPTGQSRGLGFTARAMEVFEQRGLLSWFGDLEKAPLGHFGGVQFDYTVLEDAHFGARGVPQSHTEDVLERWALSLGADIRRGWEFLELDEPDDGSDDRVEITVATPQGVQRLSAPYLVGCGGGSSPVRRAAGFAFPGTDATRTMYLADVAGCELRPRFLGERLPGGMVMAAPLGDGVDRIIVVPDAVPGQERERTVGFTEIADAWQHITGEDISAGTAHWVSSFTDATRQVTEYRRGRILLAGDAAHVHLPAGGQGLSTGVQDAANLGWKLAAEVTGRAPAGLLDSYHTERHAAGKRLLMNTHAQGMLFVGGPEMGPLRELMGELIQYDDVKRHLAGLVSGLDVRYDVGPGTHPLLGRRLPPRTLTAATGPLSTMELLHPARGLLLDLADDAGLRTAAAPWQDRVVTATVRAEDSEPVLSATTALLVRPDGYVAWAADTGTGTDPEDLRAALQRWFGDPQNTAGTAGEAVATGSST